MRDYALSRAQSAEATGSASILGSLIRNWRARRAVARLDLLDDRMLRDIGAHPGGSALGLRPAALRQRRAGDGGTRQEPGEAAGASSFTCRDCPVCRGRRPPPRRWWSAAVGARDVFAFAAGAGIARACAAWCAMVSWRLSAETMPAMMAETSVAMMPSPPVPLRAGAADAASAMGRLAWASAATTAVAEMGASLRSSRSGIVSSTSRSATMACVPRAIDILEDGVAVGHRLRAGKGFDRVERGGPRHPPRSGRAASGTAPGRRPPSPAASAAMAGHSLRMALRVSASSRSRLRATAE